MSEFPNPDRVAEVAQILEINNTLNVMKDYNEMVIFDVNIFWEERKKLRNKKSIDNNNLDHNGEHFICPDWPVSRWLVDNCNRDMAESLLSCKSNGTFLIRKSSLYLVKGHFAMSIAYNNNVYHCLIEKFQNGYGFAKCHTFPSLEHLVLYYRYIKPLDIHNKVLKTFLMHPVF